MVTTLTLQVKVVELCETTLFSADFVPGEVWLWPAGFCATNISKVSSFTKWKKLEFNAFETMAANMNKQETSSDNISSEDMNFSQSTIENNSANNLTFSVDKKRIYDL